MVLRVPDGGDIIWEGGGVPETWEQGSKGLLLDD